MGMRPNGNRIEGGILQPPASVGDEYSRTMVRLLRTIHKDVMAGVREIHQAHAEDALFGGDGGKSRAQMLIEFLLNKYRPIIDVIVRRAVERMLGRVLKTSDKSLKASMRQMGAELSVNTDFERGRLKEISTAAAEESALLIKAIPERYLQDVQIALLQSVSNGGKGISDLLPVLTKLYKGNRRRAHLAALDQTRKFYNTVQAERMKSVGITEFVWQHSGGGRDPRKEHQEMHGEVYSLAAPPKIGVMYGKDVYGLPGQLPNCRCTMRPVINFEKKS